MLTLQIKEKEIENLTPEEEFVRGTVGAKCQINFDEFWQGYNKYIVFKRVGYEPINFMVDTLENEIEIPYTILAESGEFKIGVFGTTETETLPTLYSKDIKILYGTDTHGTTPPTYIPSEIDQLRLSKQDKLVSGENIKTVNGESVLGSGNIKIQVEVDQIYDPDSTNAQSGKTVAEAVSTEQKRADNIFSNALKGSKSGSVILIDDISPVTHEMDVKVRRKNLLPPADSGIYYKGTVGGGKPLIYNSSFAISNFNDINVSSYNGVYAVIKLTEGETYTLTVNNLVNNCATKRIWLVAGFRSSESTVFGTSEMDNATVSTDYNLSSLTFTVPSGYPYCIVGFYNYPTVSGDTVSFDAMQLEEGTTATSYTPYISDLTAVKVTRCGKNLIPYPYTDTTKTFNGITFTVNADGSITVSGTATADIMFFLCSVANYTIYKGTYTLSGCPSGGSNTTYCQVLGSSDFMDIGNGVTRTYSQDIKQNIFIKIFSGYTTDNLIFKPQLELGSTATSYEPYQGQTYTPAADGTVSNVKSLYPITTLMTDTEGAIIEAEYNRDINKAFAELQQAILSMGGNT